MTTSWIALGIAAVLVVGFIVSLAGLSLLVGAVDFLFGGPRFRVLKSTQGDTGFAFSFRWNSAKEPAKFDVFKIKLFNPFGKPEQIEVAQSFEGEMSSFEKDLDMGPAFKTLINAQGLDGARVVLEVSSAQDGVDYSQEMKGSKFKELLRNAHGQVAQSASEQNASSSKAPVYGVVPRDTIADTVPGKGAQVAIPTNPAFEKYFASSGGGAGSAGGAAQENFAVSKVWIAPGCIVCNACEDIYPEVFDVQADTCVIRPGAPLDNGLKIQESAEACPVEVIKFEKA